MDSSLVIGFSSTQMLLVGVGASLETAGMLSELSQLGMLTLGQSVVDETLCALFRNGLIPKWDSGVSFL